MKKLSKLFAVVGSLLVVLAFSSTVSADANPFAQQADQIQTITGDDGKCGEGKEKKDGKCGEGKCGEGKEKKDGKCGEGKCGEGKEKKEGKCGEGKCGGK
jgi:uncharacterized low-complexity protein